MMKYKIVKGKIINLTPEEIAIMQEEQARYEAQEKRRPLTDYEVNTMLIKQQINTLSVDDNTAIRMIAFYPSFEDIIGQTVKAGFKLTYGNKLFKTIQPEMTIQAHYPPSVNTASLYAEICETHDGSKYDPIPYDGNMVLDEGKYYVQNGITYLCIRDSGTAVYHTLADLVGIYVEVV